MPIIVHLLVMKTETNKVSIKAVFRMFFTVWYFVSFI